MLLSSRDVRGTIRAGIIAVAQERRKKVADPAIRPRERDLAAAITCS